MRVSSPPSPRPLGAHLCGRGSADRETVVKTWSRDAILCALALALALVAFGCASKPPFVWATSLPPEPPAPSHGVVPVHAGDTLAIAVRGHDSLGGTHVVGLEGYILAPLVGPVHVAGQTPESIARKLEALLQTSIESPRVSVVLMEKQIEVSVLGEVAQPGKYPIRSRDGVATALALAGGLTEYADEDSIYLVRPGSPRIRFRLRDLVGGSDSAPPIALRDGDLVVIE